MNQPFRTAALEARSHRWLGDIILIRPVSFAILTALAAAVALALVLFFIFATYTKRHTVPGMLVPSTGLIKVLSPQHGIVLEKQVTEGQRVKRGDPLFVISSERLSTTQGETQAAISRQVELRQSSLREEADKTRALQREELAQQNARLSGLEGELGKIDKLIEGQRSRVKLAEEAMRRYHGLLAQDFVSREQVQQKQEELLDQTSRLTTLERDRITVNRELGILRRELSGLPIRHQTQLAQLDRNLVITGQELTESEAKRRLVIAAPESGTATGVIADSGQTTDGSRPLVSIVPDGAELQAHLFAPSRAVGFVKVGAPVMLRYQAFPYQKFGHHRARVIAVSRTALPANELSLGGMSIGGGATGNEPLYRITVALETQSITAYGQQQPLQPGMLLDADILLESRRLYEWVLEPLFSLTGKL